MDGLRRLWAWLTNDASPEDSHLCDECGGYIAPHEGAYRLEKAFHRGECEQVGWERSQW